MGKQESMSDWFQMARDYDNIYKEEKIERWMRVTISRKVAPGEYENLYSYDLPLEIYNNRLWVIEWRKARFVCKYPKDRVGIYICPYEKMRGVKVEFKPLLDKYISAKAQITKQKRLLKEYVEYQRANNMFFEENSDEAVIRVKRKLAFYEERMNEMKEEIIRKLQDKSINNN